MDARPRAPSAPARIRAYEDVQPQYKRVTGDEEDTIIVDLTGFKNEAQFKKEHLRIHIDLNGNLKVSGERPPVGGGSRWGRFERVFHLPEDCNASGIGATFEDGVLTVRIPKLAWNQQPALQPAEAWTPSPVPTPAPAPAPAPGKVSMAATARQEPPAAAQAVPTPAPASAPAKVSAPAPALQESKVPAAIPGAAAATVTTPPSKRPEDGRNGGKTVPEKGKPPADDRQKATAADKKVAVQMADVTGRTPPPPIPAEKATPHVRKPTVVDSVEEEKPGLVTGGVDVGDLSGRPRQLLVNVVVAVLVLVGLAIYLMIRSTQ